MLGRRQRRVQRLTSRGAGPATSQQGNSLLAASTAVAAPSPLSPAHPTAISYRSHCLSILHPRRGSLAQFRSRGSNANFILVSMCPLFTGSFLGLGCLFQHFPLYRRLFSYLPKPITTYYLITTLHIAIDNTFVTTVPVRSQAIARHSENHILVFKIFFILFAWSN